MPEEGQGLLEAPPRYTRVLGSYRGAPGPTMIALGGIHGNEPSGVRAARRVLDRLKKDRPEFRGELVALAGNLQALAAKKRYIAKDLNRQWTEERMRRVLAGEADELQTPEDREQRELVEALQEVLRRVSGPVYFLDMHTSSADGPPFLTIGDTLRNREFAMQLPCAVILGLEEQVDGALLEYMNNLGHVTMGVEGGRHGHETSAVYHEAVLWLSLVAAGMIDRDDVTHSLLRTRILREAIARIPQVTEIRYRHGVRPGDGFRMLPGFSNFTPVRKGQVLAHDDKGRIRAREDGLVLLPLYQGQGDDGFFLGREVKVVWLKLSRILRRIGVDRVIHLLPGVRRHPKLARTMVVNTLIARFFPLEVFHLLGYRKRRRWGRKLIVTRRLFDMDPPQRS